MADKKTAPGPPLEFWMALTAWLEDTRQLHTPEAGFEAGYLAALDVDGTGPPFVAVFRAGWKAHESLPVTDEQVEAAAKALHESSPWPFEDFPWDVLGGDQKESKRRDARATLTAFLKARRDK